MVSGNVYVDRGLADDGVKVPSSFGHAPARGEAFVAQRVLQDVAVRFGSGVKFFWNEHRGAIKRGPLFPAFELKAKHVAPSGQPHKVDAQSFDEVRRDLAQHQVGTDNLDRRARRVQGKRLAQTVHCTDVHAGHAAAAQIQRDAIGLLMVQGQLHPFSCLHRCCPPPGTAVVSRLYGWRKVLNLPGAIVVYTGCAVKPRPAAHWVSSRRSS